MTSMRSTRNVIALLSREMGQNIITIITTATAAAAADMTTTTTMTIAAAGTTTGMRTTSTTSPISLLPAVKKQFAAPTD